MLYVGMKLVGTGTWWKQQAAILVVLVGVTFLFVNVVAHQSVLGVLIGGCLIGAGSYLFRKYDAKDRVERLEKQIYNSD